MTVFFSFHTNNAYNIYMFMTSFTRLINLVLFLVEKIIRYITSDCDAVSIIHEKQGYAKTPEDAVVDVLKAGIG